MTFGLIDQDTPNEAYTTTSWKDGSQWTLVYSDEFNIDGRTFYPGDDPYWEVSVVPAPVKEVLCRYRYHSTHVSFVLIGSQLELLGKSSSFPPIFNPLNLSIGNRRSGMVRSLSNNHRKWVVGHHILRTHHA